MEVMPFALSNEEYAHCILSMDFATEVLLLLLRNIGDDA
jgi:hypothetical protein